MTCRALSPGSGNSWGTYRGSRVEVRGAGGPAGQKKFRRALFCQPLYEDRQRLLEFARPDQILYTNLGCGSGVDEELRAARLERWLEAEALLEGYHRGADELVHRALKDFASQTLPFKRFPANAAFYYTMLVAFFLYESFKQDVCDPVVPLSCYATTLRRRLLDVAGKIVRHAGQILLKVTTHLGAASNPATVGEERQSSGLWLDLKPGGTGAGRRRGRSVAPNQVGLAVAPALHLFFTPSGICIRRDAQRELHRGSDSLTSLSLSAKMREIAQFRFYIGGFFRVWL